MKKLPIRTCLGCGKKAPKHELKRFVPNPAGGICIDSDGRACGRGAYCCDNEKCYRLFVKNKKKVLRALRLQAGEWFEEWKP